MKHAVVIVQIFVLLIAWFSASDIGNLLVIKHMIEHRQVHDLEMASGHSMHVDESGLRLNHTHNLNDHSDHGSTPTGSGSHKHEVSPSSVSCFLLVDPSEVVIIGPVSDQSVTQTPGLPVASPDLEKFLRPPIV